MVIPKYAKLEIERRWLVAPDAVVDVAAMPSRLLEDWYVDGARLRLRRESIGDQPPSVWKLCKKYGEPVAFSQPMVNIYLDEAEYAVLRRLSGRALRKRRHAVSPDGPLKLDVFEGELAGHRSCEFEAQSWDTVAAFGPPAWAGPEITAHPGFFGGALASATAATLNSLIREVLAGVTLHDPNPSC